MFKSIKKIFTKKQPDITHVDMAPIIFKDLKAQDIKIEIKPTGMSDVFTITENKTKTEIVFEKDQCLLLGMIFTEFGTTGSLSEIVQILNEEGN